MTCYRYVQIVWYIFLFIKLTIAIIGIIATAVVRQTGTGIVSFFTLSVSLNTIHRETERE
jgi:hypothetical protein